MNAGANTTGPGNWDTFWSTHARTGGTSWSKRRITALLARYVHEGMSVLDAGCGSGFFSAWFMNRGCRVYSLDYSKEALEMAKAATGGKAEGYLLADLLDKRFGKDFSGRFDVIFTDGLFEHFSQADQDRIMDNFKAVLRPGGIVVTFCPNRYSPWELIRPFYMPGIKEEPFTRGAMARLHRGLEVVEKGGLNVLPVRWSPERVLGGVFGMLLYTIAQKS